MVICFMVLLHSQDFFLSAPVVSFLLLLFEFLQGSNRNFSTWRTKICLTFSSVSVSFVTLAFIDASVIDNQFVSDGDKKENHDKWKCVSNCSENLNWLQVQMFMQYKLLERLRHCQQLNFLVLDGNLAIAYRELNLSCVHMYTCDKLLKLILNPESQSRYGCMVIEMLE